MSFSTLEMATGKFYMEVLVVKQAADRMQVGIINSLVENYSENNTQMTNSVISGVSLYNLMLVTVVCITTVLILEMALWVVL